MPCTPSREPDLISISDLIYPPAQYERRFLTGWWTRGVIPLDQFTESNWSGLIIPDTIEFVENEVIVKYAGRWWGVESCPRSLPKTELSIQYLCKGGRAYLHSEVRYGKKYEQQTYAGHNGARKYSRISLEKVESNCSLEIQADIPVAKADVLDLRHFADWLATMLAVPSVQKIGLPNSDWAFLLADYTELDFAWAPCDGCLFPTQNYSVPTVLSSDTMLQLEARLSLQSVKALGEVLILGSIPDSFSVPLCLNNTYLEVSTPSLLAVVHMREFFDCGGDHLFDNYYTMPVKNSDIVNCFSFPTKRPWPEPNDPGWQNLCTARRSQLTCTLGIGIPGFSTPTGYVGDATPLSTLNPTNFGGCDTSANVPGKRQGPSGSGSTSMVTVVASIMKTVSWYQMTCIVVNGYYGSSSMISCQQVTSQIEEIAYQERMPIDAANIKVAQLWAANSGPWNCSRAFSQGNQASNPGAPLNNPPPQGPDLPGDCFFEAELVYKLNLTTILGVVAYEWSLPIRAKVPSGTTHLGAITATVSGSTINIRTAIGGSFTSDLSALLSAFSAMGRVISDILPVSFGLRNTRLLCPPP